ncbi:MAG TPA: NAD(P)H-binding protein [Phytomonospora sp.]
MILVTGASGALGRLVTEHLAEAPGLTVTAGTRDPGAWNGPQVEVRAVDFDDPATLPGAFDGVTTLVFITAGFAEDDVVYARHKAVVDAAAAAGVRNIVYTSLTGGADRLSIAVAHRYTERVLAEAPVEATVLRNGLYAELVAGMLAAPALATGRLPGPIRDGRVPAVVRADLAEAAANVAADIERGSTVHNGRVYELEGPEDLGLDDITALLAEAGRPGVEDGRSLAELREASAPAPGYQVGHTVSIFAVVAGGLITRGDSDLPELLGREPTPVREHVGQVLAHLASAAG